MSSETVTSQHQQQHQQQQQQQQQRRRRHATPTAPRPTPSQQRSFVAARWQTSADRRPNEAFGVIDADWFRRWCAHVEFDPIMAQTAPAATTATTAATAAFVPAAAVVTTTTTTTTAAATAAAGSAPAPGFIDNRILRSTSRDHALSKSHLRPNLREGVDFYLLPDAVSSTLFTWYGGAPQFTRWTTTTAAAGAPVTVQVYPFVMRVFEADMHTGESCDDESQVFCVNHGETLQDFLESYEFRWQPNSTLSSLERRLWGRSHGGVVGDGGRSDGLPSEWTWIRGDDMLIVISRLGIDPRKSNLELKVEQAWANTGWPCGNPPSLGADDVGRRTSVVDDDDRRYFDDDDDDDVSMRGRGRGLYDDADDDYFQRQSRRDRAQHSLGRRRERDRAYDDDADYFRNQYANDFDDMDDDDMDMGMGPYQSSSSTDRPYETSVYAYAPASASSPPPYAGWVKPPLPPAMSMSELPPAGTVVVRGATGLHNLGNTCYMNSVLQCLSHAPALTAYFSSDAFVSGADVNKTNPLGHKGRVAIAYGTLLRDLWSGTYQSVRPVGLKRTIAKCQPMFADGMQHDAAEMLDFVLDGLHEDLNRVLVKPTTTAVEGCGRPADEIAAESWTKHMARNDSVIVDQVQGQLYSKLECLTCHTTSVKIDAYTKASIALPNSNDRTLHVTFVPHGDGSSSSMSSSMTMTLSMTLDGDGTIADLTRHVATMAPVESTSTSTAPGWRRRRRRLVVADVWNHFVFRFLDDDAPLSTIRSRDSIHVYETYVTAAATADAADAADADAADAEYDALVTWHPMQLLHQWRRAPTLASTATTAAAAAVVPVLTAAAEGVGRPSVVLVPFVTNAADADSAAIASVRAHRRALIESAVQVFVVAGTTDQVADADAAAAAAGDAAAAAAASGADAVESTSSTFDFDFSFDVALLADARGRTCASCAAPGCPGCVWTPDTLNKSTVVGTVAAIGICWHWRDSAAAAAACGGVPVALVQYLARTATPPPPPPPPTPLISAGAAAPTVLTLADCLAAFTEPETLGDQNAWFCPTCRSHQHARKSVCFWSLPSSLLVLQLKRFSFSGPRQIRSKLSAHVDFPVTGLSLDAFMAPDAPPVAANDAAGPSPDVLYDLVAVVNHFGGSSGGHYTSLCKNEHDGKWYEYNDFSVAEVTDESKLVTKEAYILFYQRRRRSSAPSTPSAHAH